MARIRDEDQDSGTRLLIEDLLAKPRSFDRDEILARARKRKYHSFAEGAYPLPEIELIKHLNAAGFEDLAENVTQDKYAQDSEESRKWAEETKEGREMAAMVNANPLLKAKLDTTMRAIGKAQEEGRLKVPSAASFGKDKPWKKGN